MFTNLGSGMAFIEFAVKNGVETYKTTGNSRDRIMAYISFD
jgi:hypothetical protein